MRPLNIQTERDFAPLEAEWDGLLSASRQDGPFLRLDWVRSWWETFGEGELSVLTCRDGRGRLVGLLPGYTTRRGRVLPARTLRLLGDHDVGSTGLTPFADPAVEDEVFQQLADHVRSAEWDFLDLRFMDPAHAFFGTISDGRRVRVNRDCAACPRIGLPDDWDGYLKHLTKHMRHEVRRSRRRVEERGITFELVTGQDVLPEAVDDLLRLYEGRMRTVLGPAFALPEAHRTFTLRTMRTLLAEGRLRLMFMRQDDRRLAALYVLRHGDTMYAELTAFDEEAGRQDVSRALWGYALEAAIAEGCRVFDTLLGDQDYKHNWGVTDLRQLSEVRVYNASLSAEVRRGHDALVALSDRGSTSASRRPSAAAAATAPDEAAPRRDGAQRDDHDPIVLPPDHDIMWSKPGHAES
jgi:CelD/BcsL family acetyltransferase involved in cellulose biosynthesis